MRGAVQMQITTIGLDIAKNVFQVHLGNIVSSRKPGELRRRDRTGWLGHQDSNLGMAESNLLFHTSIGTTLSNGSIFRRGRWVTTETDPCRPNRNSRLLDI